LGDLPPTTVVDQPLAAGARASDDVMRGAELSGDPSPARRDTPLEARWLDLDCGHIESFSLATAPLHKHFPIDDKLKHVCRQVQQVLALHDSMS